jgi:hypothetical protein
MYYRPKKGEVLRTFSCTLITRSLTPSSFLSKQVMQRQVLKCPLPVATAQPLLYLTFRRVLSECLTTGRVWVHSIDREGGVPAWPHWWSGFCLLRSLLWPPLWLSLLTACHGSNRTLSPPTPLMYFAKYCCCVHLSAALYHDVRTGQRGWNTYI